MIVGYARVSVKAQSFAAQVDALKAAGAEKVYAEVASGALSDCPQLALAIEALGKGDTLLVTKLDRLARSESDFRRLVGVIVAKGAAVWSLGSLGRTVELGEGDLQ